MPIPGMRGLTGVGPLPRPLRGTGRARFQPIEPNQRVAPTAGGFVRLGPPVPCPICGRTDGTHA